MSYEEEGEKSIFNAGVAQAERIDSLQRAINASRFNVLAVNPETMTYNYQVIIDANNGLLDEAWAKLSDDEQKLGLKLKKLINDFIEIKPPMKKITNGMSEEMKINKDNYKDMLKLIDIYSRTIKEFLNSHDMNSPSKDEDDDRYS